MVAPASADVIAKMANGIADDMLTTVVLAAKCRKVVAPAMNTNMYENPITLDNIKKLHDYGFEIIEPSVGLLACNDVGPGKMPEPSDLLEYILKDIAHEKDMEGLNVLVTAGPTQESMDPVRFITNHSTGKMGYAIAKVCMLRGANVTLVTGETRLDPPRFIDVIKVTSTQEMYNVVTEKAKYADFVFKAAAVADYTPAVKSDDKIKKKDDDMSIALERTKDILSTLGQSKKAGQVLCGFSMETKDMLENSRKKLVKKNVDMIVANNLKVEGAGFGTDTNVCTIITKDHERQLEKLSKFDAAVEIVNEALSLK